MDCLKKKLKKVLKRLVVNCIVNHSSLILYVVNKLTTKKPEAQRFAGCGWRGEGDCLGAFIRSQSSRYNSGHADIYHMEKISTSFDFARRLSFIRKIFTKNV